MRTFLFFFVCFLMMPFYSQSQDILKDLETRKAGEGKVTIHQDSRIGALIGKPDSNNGSGEKKVL